MIVAPIRAVEWVVGPSDDFRNGISEVRIVNRGQRDGSTFYAVTMRGWTANHDQEREVAMTHGERQEVMRATSRTAYLGDREMWLDDRPVEGARIEIREDFDDEDSPVIGIYTLHHDGKRWVLN
jgi:hypothetical protein